MTFVQLCRDIVGEIYGVQNLEFEAAKLAIDDNETSQSTDGKLKDSLQDKLSSIEQIKTSLQKWKTTIDAYIEEFCIVDQVSTLILTSTPIISSSTVSVSSSNNPTVEIIVQKLAGNIKQKPGTNRFNDFTAKYAREELKFLFLDVCFGKDKVEPVHFNLTIKFVNQLIKTIVDGGQSDFKVIDMRAPGSEFRSKNDLTLEKSVTYCDLGCPHSWINNPLNLHVLNKLYYKPGFDELVEQIEKDSNFKNLEIRLGRNTIMVKDYLSVWLKTIREEFLDKHYPSFDLDQLEMIVLGSSGVRYPINYNTRRALVADDDFTGIPVAVENFITYLNKALSRNVGGNIEKSNLNYDFKCKQLKYRVLFINVCLSSTHSNEQEWVNAACSIMFVNKILEKLLNVKQKIAILDVRMVMHTHKDNLQSGDVLELINELKTPLESLEQSIHPIQPCGSIFKNINDELRNLKINLSSKIDSFASKTVCQDTVSKAAKFYYQNESCFEIINPVTKYDPNGYHRYVRLGNPGLKHYNSSDEAYCVEQLRQLHNEGFPIGELFEPMPKSP